MRRRLTALPIALGVIAIWFFLPYVLPKPKPAQHVQVVLAKSRSQTISRPFKFSKYSKMLYADVKLDLQHPGWGFDILDSSGKMICGVKLPAKWDDSLQLGVVGDSGFPPGDYTLQIRENNSVGSYSVNIYPSNHQPADPWPVRLLLTAVYFVAFGVWYVSTRWRRSQGTSAAWARFLFFTLCFSAFLMVSCPLVHESGHAFVLAAYHHFSLRGSDFLGLHGTPHVGWLPRTKPSDFEVGLTGFSGPMLPNILGYILFAVWTSKFGKRKRDELQGLDIFWSGFIAVMLFMQVGCLMSIFGMPDGDFRGFVQGFHLAAWQASLIQLAILAVNIPIIYLTGRQMFSRYRRLAKPA